MGRVFIPKERHEGERRVAATPETVTKLVGAGWEVFVEEDAGACAFFSNEAYAEAGAEIVAGTIEAWSHADVVCKVRPPAEDNDVLQEPEAEALGQGAVLIGLLEPYTDSANVARYLERGVTAVAMELIPRISRAQSMDALSSQASAAGYLAVVLAAARIPKYFPLMMTAAGTIKPAKVVVLGAGVAGLQAIATAKRLGAVVDVSDIRPDVAEQVASLGANFIPLPETDEDGSGEGGYAKEVSEEFLHKQRAIVHEYMAKADVVVSTAQVPGKRAPILIHEETVDAMRPGSVIVDLAAAQGGNCALTEPGQEVDVGGVTILGRTDLNAMMATDTSALYARNVLALLRHISEEGALALDLDDEITGQSILSHEGRLVHERARAVWLEAGLTDGTLASGEEE